MPSASACLGIFERLSGPVSWLVSSHEGDVVEICTIVEVGISSRSSSAFPNVADINDVNDLRNVNCEPCFLRKVRPEVLNSCQTISRTEANLDLFFPLPHPPRLVAR